MYSPIIPPDLHDKKHDLFVWKTLHEVAWAACFLLRLLTVDEVVKVTLCLFWSCRQVPVLCASELSLTPQINTNIVLHMHWTALTHYRRCTTNLQQSYRAITVDFDNHSLRQRVRCHFCCSKQVKSTHHENIASPKVVSTLLISWKSLNRTRKSLEESFFFHSATTNTHFVINNTRPYTRSVQGKPSQISSHQHRSFEHCFIRGFREPCSPLE